MHGKSNILAAFLVLASQAFTQTSWRVEKLGTSDGLSEGLIYTIHQDKKGFIWAGTHGGLNRYDGYGFKVFQYRPFNASSLGDNGVFFLTEDTSTGKFWIGGSSCLNEFDPQNFTNIRYRYAHKEMEFSDGIFINPHEILLACEYDVLLFDTRQKIFHSVPVYNEHDQRTTLSRVENVAADKKGHYMILSKTGIFFFDPVSRTCKRKTDGSPDLTPFNMYGVFNVLEDRNGFFWIATDNKGLIRYEPRTKDMRTLSAPTPANITTLRFDIVTEDTRGNIWAGSANGLFKIHPLTLASEYFSSDQSEPLSLSHHEINAITEDRNHNIWVGTIGGGINKLIPQNARFKNLLLTTGNNQTSTGTYIMGLQPVGQDIWFVNIWDQVGKVNIFTKKVTRITKPVLPNNYTWYSEGSILMNSQGIPMVLNGENIFHFSPKEKTGVSVSEEASPGLTHIYQTANRKTYYMVKTVGEKTFCRNDTVYGNQFFYDATEDAAGNLWIGSSKGLIQLNTRTNGIIRFRHDDKNVNSISSDFIYGLEIDDHHEYIWMAAYNGGLCSYHIPTRTFHHYTKDDGLADNIVYAIEKDHHGNLWFTSNAGISTYQVKNKVFRNYSKTDGLLNDEFNRRASCKNDSGWIFFGGIFGIDYFHPDSIIKDNTVPNLAFTGFTIYNTDYIPDSRKAIPEIILTPNDRYISIEFAALGYNDMHTIQYAYRFNNSSEWVKLGNQHILSFSNLPTGEHRLYVQCTNMEGHWLDNAIACNIIMLPAWWQTWWFRTGLAILIAGFIALMIRLYIQRKLEKQRLMLEKQQAVELERTRIATDMHDELGAGLSRIKFLSETIGIKKQQQLPVEEEIHSIREYSHEMIDKMGEIVWALNEKNDSLLDLLAYTRMYAMQYLMQHDIDCTITMPDQFPSLFVSGEFRRNIYLTVKEALHNIVKHAQATTVTIHININHELTISIADNGIGFDAHHIRPFSNGFTNMRKRIESLGGTLIIQSGRGTTATLSVPLP